MFHSTYTGEASFDMGAELYGKSNFVSYDFTAVFAYDTSMGTVTTTPLAATYAGPLSVTFVIGGSTINLTGSSSSYVSREQTVPIPAFPYFQNFASDEVFTGPGVFVGDYVAAGVSFISQNPIDYIPPSVTTPFSVTGGNLDNIGSFSIAGGLATGSLSSALLVVTAVPLPGTAPLFGVALAVVGLAGARLKRSAIDPAGV